MATVGNETSGLRMLRISCLHCSLFRPVPSSVCCRGSSAVPAGVPELELTNLGLEQQKLFWRREGPVLMPMCASSGCSTRWRAAVLTWRATPSRRRRRRRWSSRRRRRQQQQQQQPRPSRRRAVTVAAAAAAGAAAPARMKMQKYSSRPEVEGVARLDPASLLVVSLFFLALFLPEPSGLGFSAAISSRHMFHFTLPVLTKPEWWITRFVSTWIYFFLRLIRFLFYL